MIDKPEEYDKMYQVEQQLWWYKILHEQVQKYIQKHFSSLSIRILDAACGTGGLISYLEKLGFSSVEGFDISESAVEKSKERTGKDIVTLDLKEAGLFYKGRCFDVVVCNDALYFIKEDQLPDVLHDLLGLLSPNGKLIINLPAGNLFSGMHDRSVGIKKRWNYSKFEKYLQLSGVTYQRTEYFYWPFLLTPLILSVRLFQRLRLNVFPEAKITSDVSMPPLVLNEIFYKLTKWEQHLPFTRRVGSSLFIVIHR